MKRTVLNNGSGTLCARLFFTGISFVAKCQRRQFWRSGVKSQGGLERGARLTRETSGETGGSATRARRSSRLMEIGPLYLVSLKHRTPRLPASSICMEMENPSNAFCPPVKTRYWTMNGQQRVRDHLRLCPCYRGRKFAQLGNPLGSKPRLLSRTCGVHASQGNRIRTSAISALGNSKRVRPRTQSGQATRSGKLQRPPRR